MTLAPFQIQRADDGDESQAGVALVERSQRIVALVTLKAIAPALARVSVPMALTFVPGETMPPGATRLGH